MAELIPWVILCVSGILITFLTEAARRSGRQAEETARRNAELLAEREALDIRERYIRLLNETQKEHLLLAAIVESSEDAIVSKDLESKILSWNNGAKQLFGYSADEALGQQIQLIIPPDLYDEETHILAELKLGHRIEHYETMRLRKDGSLFPVAVSVSPIKDLEGRVIGASNITRDISERKRAEEDLRKSKDQLAEANETLEQKVRERTTKLQEAVAELEYFSYTITHDMRAPLRAMRGFSQILLEDAAACLDPGHREYLLRIAAASDRMDNLIRDALNYSKLVHQEFDLQPVDVQELLREIIESYPGLQPPRSRIHIDGSIPPVQGNKAGLIQCFSNLLNNAIKFVAPGTTPEVCIYAEERPGAIRIWFVDNGIGIPLQYHEKIFQMFQQLNKTYEGTGIGLALVRKAAQRMGGSVGVESEAGRGSRFWLEFAKAPVPAGLLETARR